MQIGVMTGDRKGAGREKEDTSGRGKRKTN